MNPGVAITGMGLVDGSVRGEDHSVDPNRLRRMDRFGRLGFLSGSLALREAGCEGADPRRDPARSGIVFGTSFGCRDSITDHALLVAATTKTEELRPALFAQTVHNAVNGELAIAWGLGGISEVIVSGRCAGLEALMMGALLLHQDAADRVVAGGCEGLHEAMIRAWADERECYGDQARDVDVREASAALVLAPVTVAGAQQPRLRGGTLFFEPDPCAAAMRVADWTKTFGADATAGRPELCMASVALEREFLPALRGALGETSFELRARTTEEGCELFGASGAVGAVESVRRIRAGSISAALVVVRDPEGPTAAVWLTAGEN